MKQETELDVRKRVYVHNNYKVMGIMSPPSSVNKSPLARILNALIEALHIKGAPPQYILLLANKNLVDYYTFVDKAMHWLFNGMVKALYNRMDLLHRYSRPQQYPMIYVIKLCLLPDGSTLMSHLHTVKEN